MNPVTCITNLRWVCRDWRAPLPRRYLCDFTYYTSLYLSRGRSAFVHVPPLGKPYSGEDLGRALQAIIHKMLELLDQKEEKIHCQKHFHWGPPPRALDTREKMHLTTSSQTFLLHRITCLFLFFFGFSSPDSVLFLKSPDGEKIRRESQTVSLDVELFLESFFFIRSCNVAFFYKGYLNRGTGWFQLRFPQRQR